MDFSKLFNEDNEDIQDVKEDENNGKDKKENDENDNNKELKVIKCSDNDYYSYYDEKLKLSTEELLEEAEDDFCLTIKKRGRYYYEEYNIEQVYKNGNTYIAKVYGTRAEPYRVELKLNDDHVEYNCDCPCDFNCKHEYAVLLAIKEGNYEEIKLEDEIEEKEVEVDKLLEKIPAEDLKEYMISVATAKEIKIIKSNLFNNFKKYMPKQSYKYYYNKLYNNIVLRIDVTETLDEYLNNMKKYIVENEFTEAVKIAIAIIAAFIESKEINEDTYICDYFVEKLPIIEMNLRIAYRKGDTEDKKKIKKLINVVEKDKYCNNYFLEDIVLNLKSNLNLN